VDISTLTKSFGKTKYHPKRLTLYLESDRIELSNNPTMSAGLHRRDTTMPKRKRTPQTRTKPEQTRPEPEPVPSDSETSDSETTELPTSIERLPNETLGEFSDRLAALVKATKRAGKREAKAAGKAEAFAQYQSLVTEHATAIAGDIYLLNPEKRIRMLSVQIRHVGDSTEVEVTIKSARIVKPKSVGD
jgi:hypothetical protein